jgi:phosphoribosylaminoimidazole (AIR) synthetase
MSEKNQSLSYKDAGVDIDAGNALMPQSVLAALKSWQAWVVLAHFSSYPQGTKNPYWCLVLTV